MRFNIFKAIGKFFLGFIASAIGIIVQNPEIIVNLIPEKIATMTVAGLVVELLDYIHHILTKKE